MPSNRLTLDLPFVTGSALGQTIVALDLDDRWLHLLGAAQSSRTVFVACVFPGRAETERTNAIPLTAHFVRCNAAALPFLSHAIDAAVAAAAALEDEEFVAEIRRALAPGGTLVGLMYGRSSERIPFIVASLRGAGFSVEPETESSLVAHAPHRFKSTAAV